MNKWIIRTSDRKLFKQCRQKWDFGSKLRMNLEPLFAPKPLDFGTAIHRGLQTYYEPSTWAIDRDVVRALSVQSFADVCNEQKRQYIKISSGDMAIDLEIDYKERVELGKGMLEYYFKYAKLNDKFKPVFVEVEFEVPIMRCGISLPMGFEWDLEDRLTYMGAPVFYQGRVDLVVEDEFGEYWIVDHKTAAQFGDTQHLALDEQCGSYIWALRHQLNLRVAGVIYNELRKKVPHKPNVLKNGSLSCNKQQDTTYDLFMEAIHEGGYSPDGYTDFLAFLKENPKEFVRRTQVHRNPREMDILQRRIALEAIDMLTNPSIYPNPVKWNCDGCWFFAPCVAQQEAGDVQFILREGYKKRDSNAA
jgi:hypothetical protein